MRILPSNFLKLSILIGLQYGAVIPASAIGPTPPIRFRDFFERLELVIEPQAQGELSASWTLYDLGKPIRQERLDLEAEQGPEGESIAPIPLSLDEFSDLTPGYYAVKIVVVQTLPRGEEAMPLQADTWLHLVVSDSGAHRVTQEEYSGAVDPGELGIDGNGEKILLSSGASGEADIPLEKTEHHEAQPLGPGAGALEELPPSKPQSSSRDESKEP